MKKSNIQFVFFGTPHMAVYVLDELEKEGLLPSLVVCAPDRPAGRGMDLREPEAKKWAQKRDIEVFQPQKLDEEVVEYIQQMQDWDVGVVAAYGNIIPASVIDIPKRGILNVHPSLLPRYRGASPIRSQILADEKKVGVTIMSIDEKLDHGPLVVQETVDISPWPPKGSALEEKLFRKGGKLLAGILPQWVSGEIEAQPQDHDSATFTSKISKKDGEINLSDDPYENYLKIQAFDSWPRTYFYIDHKGEKKRVIISEASFEDGQLNIERVIPQGKQEMSYEDFKRGFLNS